MGKGRGRWDRKQVLVRHRDALSEIDWREFERLLADYYRDEGFDVQHDGTAGRGVAFDGGVDLRLRKDGKLTLVQCKHENVFQTEHNVVNELLGIKVNEGADEAIVITSGEFTAAARRFGSQGHVQLIDGIQLRRMLGSRLLALAPSPTTFLQTAAERFAWEAVDHIGSSGRSRRRSGVLELSIRVLAIKFAIGLIGIVLFVFIVPAVLPRLFVALLASTPQRTQIHSELTPTLAASASVQRASAFPAPTTAAVPRTAAEQEAERQANAKRDAEVQRYLESVPEVTHYRYSPQDANKDPAPELQN